MDPNANLAEQAKLCLEIHELFEQIVADAYADVAHGLLREKALRLAELVQALNRWLMLGGFLPDAWKR